MLCVRLIRMMLVWCVVLLILVMLLCGLIWVVYGLNIRLRFLMKCWVKVG